MMRAAPLCWRGTQCLTCRLAPYQVSRLCSSAQLQLPAAHRSARSFSVIASNQQHRGSGGGNSCGSGGSVHGANGGEHAPASGAQQKEELSRSSLAPEDAKEKFPEGDKQPLTYRQMLAEWFYLREADLRGLASEGRLQIRDFLADPSVKLFGREVNFDWMKSGQELTQQFDLKSFTGSFSRVADLSAWYGDKSASEQAQKPAVEDDGAAEESDGRHPAAVAFERGGPAALGFGFSAGGLLFSYYIGVIYALHDLGIVTRDTKLAGASAGSLIAACYHSGLPEELVTSACWELAADCRENGTRGRLGSVLRTFLEDLLPDDIHERCRDRAYVAVTRVFPRPTGELISDFQSREDLIEALLTSCHVPWWFDKRVWTTFRGAASYDGGLTNFIPLPPTEHGTRICCFASKQITSVVNIDVSPDSFSEWEHSVQQMVAWAFEPAEEEMLKKFVEKGRADAKAWAEATGVLPMVDPSKQQKQQGTQRANMEDAAGAPAAA